MGKTNSSSALLTFHLSVLSFFLLGTTVSSDELLANLLEEGACATAYCGHGTCNVSSTALLGYECECDPGWKKFQLGPFTFPACDAPNCTLEYQCGNGAPPPPPPETPPFNLSDPCSLIWCGDGTCVPNGTFHICQCFDGSENLLNSTALACFKQCYFGSDCYGLGLGSPPTPPSSGSPESGSTNVPNSSGNLRALGIIILSAFLASYV